VRVSGAHQAGLKCSSRLLQAGGRMKIDAGHTPPASMRT